jgi:hypothetical protein
MTNHSAALGSVTPLRQHMVEDMVNVSRMFGSQEIDSRYVAERRSNDQSRNGCWVCHFCHAQLFEITHAENIKSLLVQPSCQSGLQVEGEFELGRLHDRQVAGLCPFEDLTHIGAERAGADWCNDVRHPHAASPGLLGQTVASSTNGRPRPPAAPMQRNAVRHRGV